MSEAQALPRDDLEKFIECLDSVCMKITFIHPLLNNIVDPRRPRPQQPCLFSLFVRTPEDLWRPQDPTKITHALRRSCGGRHKRVS
jgi:hypothetical protein